MRFPTIWSLPGHRAALVGACRRSEIGSRRLGRSPQPSGHPRQGDFHQVGALDPQSSPDPALFSLGGTLDCLGKVVRLCLQLGVTPVFTPPRETGFQAAIESYNARWQLQVWQRFKHPDFRALQERSAAYVTACHLKAAGTLQKARALRRSFPVSFSFQPQQPLSGTVIFLRRTNASGRVTVMGRLYEVDAHWQHRLLRVEVNFSSQKMEFFALRRSAAKWQPLLHALPYAPAAKQPGGLRALIDGATGGLRLDKRHSVPRQT